METVASAASTRLYRPRHPERTVLYRALAHHFDRFLLVYEERFQGSHGYLRRCVEPAVHRYLDCGIFDHGIARVRCPDCRHELLIAFSRKLRARRRVETPGAQAQVDWAVFKDVLVRGRRQSLYAFLMGLSHSRYDAVVWCRGKGQLAWHRAHNEAFRRLGGIPATLRVDNEKTAIGRGAGAWGEVNRAYRRYAETVRFHVDACPPRSPEAKGKIERRIRDHRLRADPRRRHWADLDDLQAWTDTRVERSAPRGRRPGRRGRRSSGGWRRCRSCPSPSTSQ